jgi:hypothetical protein
MDKQLELLQGTLDMLIPKCPSGRCTATGHPFFASSKLEGSPGFNKDHLSAPCLEHWAGLCEW